MCKMLKNVRVPDNRLGSHTFLLQNYSRKDQTELEQRITNL